MKEKQNQLCFRQAASMLKDVLSYLLTLPSTPTHILCLKITIPESLSYSEICLAYLISVLRLNNPELISDTNCHRNF